MLTIVATRFGAGVTIAGDIRDLTSLHETIHSIEKGSHIPEHLGDFILGLAYEIRHAFQGDREQVTLGSDKLDRAKYRAVKIAWPVILFQLALLRWAAGRMSTTKEEQANLLRLEHGVESALSQYDSEVASPCIDWLNGFRGVSADYLTLFITEVTYQYLFAAPGKRRIKILPSVLQSLSEDSPEYRTFRTHIEQQAREQNCSPHAFEDRSEWPTIKW
jgi:uncharacterized protein DUF6904